MRVFEDFLCAEETFAICEHEMCVDAVVDANMFVFDRDVYVYIKMLPVGLAVPRLLPAAR